MKTLQHTYTTARLHTGTRKSVIDRFFNWCRQQEKNRLAWMAFIIAGHGCVFTPLTVLFIVLAGNPVVFWPFAIGAMGMALVVNLAALPTKITIPLFFLSLLIDAVVIVNCMVAGISV